MKGAGDHRGPAPRDAEVASMGAQDRSTESPGMDVGREWVAEEVSGCRFADRRLGDRLHNLMGSLGAQVGSTIPTDVGF